MRDISLQKLAEKYIREKVENNLYENEYLKEDLVFRESKINMLQNQYASILGNLQSRFDIRRRNFRLMFNNIIYIYKYLSNQETFFYICRFVLIQLNFDIKIIFAGLGKDTTDIEKQLQKAKDDLQLFHTRNAKECSMNEKYRYQKKLAEYELIEHADIICTTLSSSLGKMEELYLRYVG